MSCNYVSLVHELVRPLTSAIRLDTSAPVTRNMHAEDRCIPLKTGNSPVSSFSRLGRTRNSEERDTHGIEDSPYVVEVSLQQMRGRSRFPLFVPDRPGPKVVQRIFYDVSPNE